jgi:hypothetical protein
MLSNFDKWRSLTDGLSSPDNYIDWGFYFMMGAALERRVWMPPKHDPVFGNKFVVFVGKPALGKGGPIRLANDILREHKREEAKHDLSKLSAVERKVVEEMISVNSKRADGAHNEGVGKNGSIEQALLFPQAANATTYQSLVQCMARSYIMLNHNGDDGKMKIYGHSSMYFCLEEMSSLFRIHTNDLVNFLLQAWDCSPVYEYTTKTQGRDRILRVCLNLLAGVTPDFMQSTFNSGLIDQGFSSRTFFIYADKDRKTVFSRAELTPEQVQFKADLARHVVELSKLFGQVRIDEDTTKFLHNWYDRTKNDMKFRASRSPKLDPYYGRSNLHVQKMAMAMHFGESTEMFIPIDTFKRAIEVNYENEKKMHLALMIGEDNPLAKIGRKMVEFLIQHGKQDFSTIWMEFFKYAGGKKEGIEEVLDFLETTNQIETVKEPHEVTKETTVYWKVKMT